MGLVPADEGLLGLEGGGVIRRVCGQAGSLHIGQRVVVSRKGSFANRVQSPIEAIHPLPDWMSFEVFRLQLLELCANNVLGCSNVADRLPRITLWSD